MIKILLLISVTFAIAAGILTIRTNAVGKPVGIVKNVFHLEEPYYEWVPCNCPDKVEPGYPPVLGLDQPDYIKHQQYMEGLKYQAQCNR